MGGLHLIMHGGFYSLLLSQQIYIWFAIITTHLYFVCYYHNIFIFCLLLSQHIYISPTQHQKHPALHTQRSLLVCNFL